MTTPMPTEISVRTTLPFEECLGLLRQKLQRERFRVVAELHIDREFENRLGVHWRKSTVLVVWDSFYAYQALLCGVNGALFLPFNISVSDEAGSTLIATMNHSADGFGQGFIGVQILTRELNRRMEQVLMEFAVHDTAAIGFSCTGATEGGRMTPAPNSSGKARRLRTVSWLLRTVAVGWIVLSVLILSLMARTSIPAHPHNEQVHPSILACIFHTWERRHEASISYKESGVTWITHRTADTLIQVRVIAAKEDRAYEAKT